jgi:hypothetical protein
MWKRFFTGELSGPTYVLAIAIAIWIWRMPNFFGDGPSQRYAVAVASDPAFGSETPLSKNGGPRIVVCLTACEMTSLKEAVGLRDAQRWPIVAVLPLESGSLREDPAARLSGIEVAPDPGFAIFRSLNVFVTPRVYVIDSRGRLAWAQKEPGRLRDVLRKAYKVIQNVR